MKFGLKCLRHGLEKSSLWLAMPVFPKQGKEADYERSEYHLQENSRW